MDEDPDRRRFLKLATCGIGGGIGLVGAVPVLRLVLDPADKQTVTTPKDPIDIGAAARLKVGPEWSKYDVIAPLVRDAWTTARDVVLGAAWVRRSSEAKVEALSATCPHLGCAVGWDPVNAGFLCPCHNSRWTTNGEVVDKSGPAKRGLDPLVVEIQDGRLRLVWARYKLDIASREPA